MTNLTYLALTVLLSTATPAREHRLKAQGSYEVPVAAQELAPFAVYETEYTFKRTATMTYAIEYTLPIELTGTEQEVEIYPDPTDSTKWSGPHAEGTCALTEEIALCELKYKNIQFDAALTEKIILSKYPTPHEQTSRMQVFRQFSGEPIGILRVSFDKNR